MTLHRAVSTARTQLLSVATVALLGAADAPADDFTDCKADTERAHADNRKSGPNWILIDDKLIVPADPRRAEGVRLWFEELKARDDATKDVERYRIVEFDIELLLSTLRSMAPRDAEQREFSATPDLVVAPFADRIYGMTVLQIDESIESGSRILVASGVLTNTYGVRGEWRLDIDLSSQIAGLHIESTEGTLQSFHTPESGLVVLGERDRCRMN